MLTLVIRSVCVGIAAIAIAAIGGAFIGGAVAIAIAMLKPSPANAPEVGWDLVVMLKDHPGLTTGLKLAALLAFIIGFVFGWRYFSRAQVAGGAER
ncbi:MAG TPA: hypothetical protein VEJ38_11815 [Candidatus Acidoferrales bacterium]|nr:hypothetical protein [Candidatus Acidoferrales bacterium]